MSDQESIKIYLGVDSSYLDINKTISYSFIMKYNNRIKKYTKSYDRVSPINCVLLGFLNSICELKRNDIPIIYYTNNSYLVNLCNKWMNKWKENNWVKNDGKPPVHLDIIKKIYFLINNINISFRYIDPSKSDYIQKCLDSCYDRIDYNHYNSYNNKLVEC